jgi:LPXTG-motif cell wall-anchored protein
MLIKHTEIHMVVFALLGMGLAGLGALRRRKAA